MHSQCGPPSGAGALLQEQKKPAPSLHPRHERLASGTHERDCVAAALHAGAGGPLSLTLPPGGPEELHPVAARMHMSAAEPNVMSSG